MHKVMVRMNLGGSGSAIQDSWERRGKKRAKRGGPDEREDEVIISYQGPKVTPSSGDSAMPTTGFSFGKQSEDEKKPSSEGLVPAKPLFTFGTASKESPKLGADSTDLASSKKEDTKESTKGESSSPFGQTQKLPTATSGFTFGSDSAVSKSAAAPLFTFGKTISKESGTGSGDQATAAFKTPTFPSVSSLPGAGGKDAKPLFSFGSSAKDSSSTDKGFKFGQSSVTTVTNGNDGSDNKDGENEEEYVPPKVEAVLEDEPDAILSTKCSVFVLKGKTYEKLGVGQLHIKKKEGESRKILLIRAATTIGTIWLNAFIDKNMKCAKADEVKLRVNCVSEGHPSTHLIRLPSAKDRERVENELSHSGNDS
ncbi:unnamed protein product [Toxocara canis]|uniref:RanBD1 domain-containing protein n=1 Tax=Toxocara canis TaxID=6265 RepID=A0A183V103_TOXCA|nr:unnamed protein product [Toxocara canis]